MKKAQFPFRFATASYLIRISNPRAARHSELLCGSGGAHRLKILAGVCCDARTVPFPQRF